MGWFQTRILAPGVAVALEPAVTLMFRAAMVTVRGRDCDLQFDFGCGIMPLCDVLHQRHRPVIAVASHAHVDHIGGFHEFSDRRGHVLEEAGFAGLPGVETFAAEFQCWPALVSEAPGPGWTAAGWTLRPAPLTGFLAEGDRIDFGDRSFTVLHLPGHSPGGIGLLDETGGLFLTGDAIYDDDILDDLPGASVPDYLATMERLRHIDCHLAIGGHGPEMTRGRMIRIAEDYLGKRG